MKKIILIAGIAILLLGGGVGGAYFFLLRPHHAAKHEKVLPKPKPILFAQLNDLVVTVPADADNSGTSFVQLSLQFATTDPDAVASFDSLQPIIKAQIIQLLMGKTAKELMDPSKHDALAKSCLDIANTVLAQQASFQPPHPFTATYITNIVEQN